MRRGMSSTDMPLLAETAMSGIFDRSHEIQRSKNPSQNEMGAPTAKWSRC